MQTGAMTLIRSSRTATVHVWDAPPEVPVHQIRSLSTSSSAQRKSSALREFQVWSPKSETPRSVRVLEFDGGCAGLVIIALADHIIAEDDDPNL